MSSIYIREPPTSGKVCLKTTVGDIAIEFWSKECPKACRNFIQLCMEGYYNNTIFHRIVPNFIAQGGDPTGSGFGGESIYGQPFKNEFDSRLRFARRGLVAMANREPNDNASQFFFTLDKTPELQNKHTIFAQVTGNTLFNMLKLGKLPVDRNERPENPQRILSVEILSNPFPDIVPRVLSTKDEKNDDKKRKEASNKAIKNFGPLSIGDKAEEEEIALDLNKKFVTKGESSLGKRTKKFINIMEVPGNPETIEDLRMNVEDSSSSDEDEEKKFQGFLSRVIGEKCTETSAGSRQYQEKPFVKRPNYPDFNKFSAVFTEDNEKSESYVRELETLEHVDMENIKSLVKKDLKPFFDDYKRNIYPKTEGASRWTPFCDSLAHSLIKRYWEVLPFGAGKQYAYNYIYFKMETLIFRLRSHKQRMAIRREKSKPLISKEKAKRNRQKQKLKQKAAKKQRQLEKLNGGETSSTKSKAFN